MLEILKSSENKENSVIFEFLSFVGTMAAKCCVSRSFATEICENFRYFSLSLVKFFVIFRETTRRFTGPKSVLSTETRFFSISQNSECQTFKQQYSRGSKKSQFFKI